MSENLQPEGADDTSMLDMCNCPECQGTLVQPVYGSKSLNLYGAILLRCPECEDTRLSFHTDAEISNYKEDFIKGIVTLESSSGLIERGIILPEDF